MAIFTITGFSTTAQTLLANETGYVSPTDGEIVVTSGDAVSITGNSTRLVNLGAITSLSGYGVQYSSGVTTGSLTNAGTITGWLGAVHTVDSSGSIDINNTGIIQGIGTGGDGIIAQSAINLTNSGVISSVDEEAIDINQSTTNSFIANSGTIIASNADAIEGEGAQETLLNGGSIVGDVDLGFGDDTINNGGTITGDVDLGAGADTYVGSGIVSGTVDGGANDDILRGGQNSDSFEGGSGQDRLFGNAGDDSLSGGNDRDRLFGGSGADELTGGEGNDLLFGGSGPDKFIYLAATDSVQGGLFDTIADFEKDVDKIDLTDVIALEFAFAGTGAFVGGGTPSVRYTVNAGNGAAIVQVDVDGNGTSDMRIAVANAPVLDAGDFLL